MAILRATLVVCLLLLPVAAAEPVCQGNLADAGRKIRTIEVRSRLNTLAGVTLPAKSGDVLTLDLGSKLVQAVRDRIRSEDLADITNRGGVQAVLVKPCYVAVGADQVDVIITPWAIRVPLPGHSDAPLAAPRSNTATVRSAVPAPLRSLDPEFGMKYDRGMDASAHAGFTTSLGELRDSVAHSPDQVRKSDVLINGEASRSLKSANYMANANLGYEHRFVSSARRVAVSTELTAERQPWANDSLFSNAMRTGVTYRQGGSGKYWRGFEVSAAHRWAGNRTSLLSTSEQGAEVRGGLDVRIPGGVARATIFGDYGRPADSASYARIATRSGVSLEVPVIPLHGPDGAKLTAVHTLGVEVQFTAGKGSSELPDYARFFGGSDSGRFVFDDSLDTQFQKPFFTGPIVRGFGQSQATSDQTAKRGTGGTSYWGLNCNVAIPIPRWSRFLIPPDPDEDGITIGQRIEGGGLNSSENLMASYYQNEEHMPEAEANAKAKADIDSVRPAVRFISRYAKLYGVRPLGIFDIGQLRDAAGPGVSRRLYSAGGGVQLTLVTVRIEAGYAWALDRRPGEPAGNVIFRLSFQNIF